MVQMREPVDPGRTEVKGPEITSNECELEEDEKKEREL
jgi:hypothetical protein